jgi:hypothetical protein
MTPNGVMPMDTPISRARARREVLEREIEFHQRNVETHQREVDIRQAEMREVETFITQYARFSGESELHVDADIKTPDPEKLDAALPRADDSTDSSGPVSQEQFESDTRRILIENGRPMKRGLLVKRFHSHGLRVGGSDEAKEIKNFGVKIWKAKEKFVNIPGEGYWPKDVACPAVDYQPGDPQPSPKYKDMFSSASH